MTVRDVTFDASAPPEMKLALRNTAPISSAELGELFVALANDYGRVTRGRILMVTEVSAGSIYATLADMALVAGPVIKDGVEIAKAAKGMADFGRAVWGVLGRAKESGDGVFTRGRKRPGQGSAEALLRIAADADAEIELEQTAPGGYATKIKVTPIEAIRIREAATSQQLMLQASKPLALLKRGDFETDTDRLTESLLSLSGPIGGPSEETRAAVVAMVRALRDSGFAFVLANVAAALEVRGRPDLAALVRGDEV